MRYKLSMRKRKENGGKLQKALLKGADEFLVQVLLGTAIGSIIAGLVMSAPTSGLSGFQFLMFGYVLLMIIAIGKNAEIKKRFKKKKP